MGALSFSYVLLLRVGKLADIGELPVNLKNYLVDVFYVQAFELFVQDCSRGPLVASTRFVVLDQNRWPVVFTALEEHVQPFFRCYKGILVCALQFSTLGNACGIPTLCRMCHIYSC